MSHVFDMTLRYANDRQQFGRAIASSGNPAPDQRDGRTCHRRAHGRADRCAGRRLQPTRCARHRQAQRQRSGHAGAAIAHAGARRSITEEYDLQIYTAAACWRLADGSRLTARVVGEGSVRPARDWRGRYGAKLSTDAA